MKLDDLYDIRNRDYYLMDRSAFGFSARVIRAVSYETGDDVAFKVMRKQWVTTQSVWEQFLEEVKILNRVQDCIPAARMLDCGLVSDCSQDIPTQGEVITCAGDPEAFSAAVMKKMGEGSWRPYLALEILPSRDCLLNLARGPNNDSARHFRLPTIEGLELAIQFAQVMIYLHENNVVYIDHKPEHVYWDGHSLRLIDFNVSKTIDALSPTEKEVVQSSDMRHFMAGVLYTVFTGLDFRTQSPGSLVSANPSDPTAVAAKFAGVTHLDFGMEPELLAPLVRLIQHAYSLETRTTAAEFLAELRRCAALAGLDGPSPQVKEHDRRARLEVQAGLAKLHDAQRLLEEARQHFLNATSHQPSDQDCLRLYRQSSEFYAQRLLP